MYALVQDSPYEAELPLAYFETEIEAQAAMHFIYDYDERKYPDLPRTDWDWGYYVKEVTPTVLAEFKAQYEIKETPNEEASYGGDNCFIGRGVYTGEPHSDTHGDTGINILTHS